MEAPRTLPSASGLARAIACPASTVLPHEPDRGSDDAARGTALHAYAESIANGMDEAEALAGVPSAWRETAEALDVRGVLDALGHDPFADQVLTAEEAFAWNPETGEARSLGVGLGRDYSGAQPGEAVGTADLVLWDATSASLVVADWKFGHGDMPRASRHPQLRALGLYGGRAYRAERVDVVVIRARTDGGAWLDRASLGASDLEAVGAELRGLARRVESHRQDPASAPAVPGEHCRYCLAAVNCPVVPVALAVAQGQGLSVLADSPHGRARLLGLVTLAKRVPEMIDTMLRDAIARGETDLGDGTALALETTAKQGVEDAAAVHAALAKIDPTAADATVPLVRKATLGGIDKAWRSLARPGEKADDAKARIRAMLLDAGATKVTESDAVVAVLSTARAVA